MAHTRKGVGRRPMKLITDIVGGLLVVSGVAVADSGIGPADSIASLVERFGVITAMLVYFLIRDYYRSKADALEKVARDQKHEELQEYIRTVLSKNLEDTVVEIKAGRKTHARLLDALERNNGCVLAKPAHDRRLEVQSTETLK
jgi:hypothetical protein